MNGAFHGRWDMLDSMEWARKESRVVLQGIRSLTSFGR